MTITPKVRSSPAKPRKAKASKPTAKPKPRLVLPKPGLRFQGRGKHKCVKLNGVSLTGVHPGLKRALWPEWDYDSALKTHRLKEVVMPPAQVFMPLVATRNDRRLAYSKGQGVRLDKQVSYKLYFL